MLTNEEKQELVELWGKRTYPGLTPQEQHRMSFLERMSRSKPVENVVVKGGGIDGRITEEGRRKFYGRKTDGDK